METRNANTADSLVMAFNMLAQTMRWTLRADLDANRAVIWHPSKARVVAAEVIYRTARVSSPLDLSQLVSDLRRAKLL